MRVNPNGFFYRFRFWPKSLRYDGKVFGYSWLGFWWSERRIWLQTILYDRDAMLEIRKEKS